jgi:hypothetical protein
MLTGRVACRGSVGAEITALERGTPWEKLYRRRWTAARADPVAARRPIVGAHERTLSARRWASAGAYRVRRRRRPVLSRQRRASYRAACTTSVAGSSVSRPVTRPEGGRGARASAGCRPWGFDAPVGCRPAAEMTARLSGTCWTYRRGWTPVCPLLLAQSGARGAPWTRVGLVANRVENHHHQRALVDLRARKPMTTSVRAAWTVCRARARAMPCGFRDDQGRFEVPPHNCGGAPARDLGCIAGQRATKVAVHG